MTDGKAVETQPAQPIEALTPALTTTQNKRKHKREKEKANKQLSEKKTKTLKPKNDNDRQPTGKTPFKLPECKPPAKPEKIDEDIAQMDPNLTADYISRQLRKFEKELSVVELEDRFIPARAFLDTTSYGNSRMLADLPEFLETSCKPLNGGKELNETCKTPGTPHTLIVTAAALRATDLVRAVKKFQTKECIVAKLFAKHIKLKESIELCNNTRIGIGVGTPGRILDLIRERALKLDSVSAIVLDMSAVNEKQQGIFDIRETHKDMLDLLNTRVIKSRLGDQTKLLVY